MKKHLYRVLLCLCVYATARAQNANELYVNNLAANNHYEAASFVVDTAPPTVSLKRAFLLWSKNAHPGLTTGLLTVDEFAPNGNFDSEHYNTQERTRDSFLLPKKIIRSRLFKGYYMLALVKRPFVPIGGRAVYSTPVVIKIDEALKMVWAYKIHFASITGKTIRALIEYNDIIEADNGDLVLAGHLKLVYNRDPNRLLATRLKTSGSIIWSYDYSFKPVCSATALSLAEAKAHQLVLTGYTDNCAISSKSGVRQLLFMTLTPDGVPMLAQAMRGGQASLGNKILQHADARGEAFFIAGTISLPTARTAPNQQLLFVDIQANGVIRSVYHIGDAKTEVANDMQFSFLGNTNYFLFFTGYTNSYASRKEAFFLQLEYKAGNMALLTFNTFTHSAAYTSGVGLEIKKAGKERWAILENTTFQLHATPFQSGYFTNILVRDLKDTSTRCIKKFQPPVRPYQLSWQRLQADSNTLNFKIYEETYKEGGRIIPKEQCGQLFIDAPASGQ